MDGETKTRGLSSVVELRCYIPRVGGSSPSVPTKKGVDMLDAEVYSEAMDLILKSDQLAKEGDILAEKMLECPTEENIVKLEEHSKRLTILNKALEALTPTED